MKSINTVWRNEPLTLEQWKANCQASSHVRPGDTLTFNTSDPGPVTACWIEGTSVHLGAYWHHGSPRDGILPGTGWNH
jgi:hypothetical protein